MEGTSKGNKVPGISLPLDLRGAHPVIRETGKAAKGLKSGGDGRITVGPSAGIVHLVLSRGLLARALLIAQAIFSEAERRGWEVSGYTSTGYDDHDGLAIVVRGHAYPLELQEMTETIPFTEEEIEEWRSGSFLGRREGTPPPQHKRKRAIGRLALHMPSGYRGGRAKWTEGPRGPLEDKLASVFEVLEKRAEADDVAAAERARHQEERRRIEAERAERARLERIEQARAERLVAETGAWERSAQVRLYIGALRERLDELDPPERQRVSEWCAWAADWADRSDPALHTELITGFDERDEQHRPPYAR